MKQFQEGQEEKDKKKAKKLGNGHLYIALYPHERERERLVTISLLSSIALLDKQTIFHIFVEPSLSLSLSLTFSFFVSDKNTFYFLAFQRKNQARNPTIALRACNESNWKSERS